ncbi:hypothetical protein LEN26_020799 [Aphanomyces euteiches]|nr:hypothetical protein LEN26_020799 [Aphanomyces euteiches]KAH9124228.1 hypothetical protein AeMF1_004964 [Aphanomyces euteiches]KAH9191585.1 hypothetical protein AeNC1_006439 [Aphanomyces euteiches]
MTRAKARQSITRHPLDAKQYNRSVALLCGRQVSYAEVGDPRGFPVICLFGMRGHRYHSYLYNNLASNHAIRLFCIDRPGYGRSDDVASSELPHPISFVYIVEQFLDALHIDRFGLIAQSAGCIYALAIAAQESFAEHLVQPVMLLAPWVGIQNPGTLPLLKLAAFCPTMLISAGVKLLDVSNDLTSLSANPHHVLAALGTRRNSEFSLLPIHDEAVPFHEFQQRIQSEPNNVLQDAKICLGKCKTGVGFDARQIKLAIRVFHGDRDALVPLKAAQEFVAGLADAELSIVKGGTHTILFDEELIDSIFEALIIAARGSSGSWV